MCRLFDICRSGYYQWLKKHEIINKDNTLINKVKDYYYKHKSKYGSRRILHLLRNEGIKINRKRVQRIMSELNLKATIKQKYKKTTNSKHKEVISPNLVNQNFNVEAPNRLFVSDITYIPTQEGWLYLMVVIDCFGRKIKTWSLRSSLSKFTMSSELRKSIFNFCTLNGSHSSIDTIENNERLMKIIKL